MNLQTIPATQLYVFKCVVSTSNKDYNGHILTLLMPQELAGRNRLILAQLPRPE